LINEASSRIKKTVAHTENKNSEYVRKVLATIKNLQKLSMVKMFQATLPNNDDGLIERIKRVNENSEKKNISKSEEVRYLDIEQNSLFTKFIELVFPKVHCMSGSSGNSGNFNPPARITSHQSSGASSSNSSAASQAANNAAAALAAANRQRARARAGREVIPEGTEGKNSSTNNGPCSLM